MLDWVTETLPAVIGNYSVIAVALVLLGGVITSIGPCNLAMIPLIMAFVGGQTEADRLRSFWLSLAFTLGSATTFMLLGVFIALVGGIFGAAKSLLYFIVAGVCLAVGLHLLHVINIEIPWFGSIQSRFKPQQGILGAYVMGLVLGLAGNQCGTPILLAILSIVMLKGKIAYGSLLLFFYALGRGVPVILAGTFTGILKNTPALTRWSTIMENAAGVVLLGIGLYFLWIA